MTCAKSDIIGKVSTRSNSSSDDLNKALLVLRRLLVAVISGTMALVVELPKLQILRSGGL